jgi:hypothetical protein
VSSSGRTRDSARRKLTAAHSADRERSIGVGRKKLEDSGGTLFTEGAEIEPALPQGIKVRFHL